jgi:lipopolysaccharide transport protein LptA
LIGSSNCLAAAKSKPEAPMRIRSEIIDIKRKSQTINFLKNVVIEKDDSSLLAQKMTLIYNEKDGETKLEGESSIKRIDAFDNVKIFTEDYIASGEIGHYDPAQNVFVLERNVVVNSGTSIASGDKFIYDLVTKKGNFVGENKASTVTNEIGKTTDKRVVVVIGGDMQETKKAKKPKQENNDQDIKRQ